MVNPLELALQQVMQGTAPQGGGGSFSPYQGLFQAPQANPMLEQIMQALQQGGLGSLIAQPGTSLDIQPRIPEGPPPGPVRAKDFRDRFGDTGFFDRTGLLALLRGGGGSGSAGGGMGGSAGGGGTGPGGAGAGSGGRA